jgi:hypothetical protein
MCVHVQGSAPVYHITTSHHPITSSLCTCLRVYARACARQCSSVSRNLDRHSMRRPPLPRLPLSSGPAVLAKSGKLGRFLRRAHSSTSAPAARGWIISVRPAVSGTRRKARFRAICAHAPMHVNSHAHARTRTRTHMHMHTYPCTRAKQFALTCLCRGAHART